MVSLSVCYCAEQGTVKNPEQAFLWAKRASVYANPKAWAALGSYYEEGFGTKPDIEMALQWYQKAAGAGDPIGQFSYAVCLTSGKGTPLDEFQAAKYFRAAAIQKHAEAQFSIGSAYLKGNGVRKSIVQGIAWLTIAAQNGQKDSADFLNKIPVLPRNVLEEVVQATRSIEREISAAPEIRDGPEPWSSPKRNPGASIPGKLAKWSGSGFIVTKSGYIVTNNHVAPEQSRVQVITKFGAFAAKVVKVDPVNDLSLLKIDGMFIPMPVIDSEKVRLGATVGTLGFPNTDIQGFSPKLTKGEISSLAGLRDDPKYFQISVPVQPGNSGGALFDDKGNVCGVVSAKINQKAAIATTGTIAENVNFAIKSSHLLALLESVPEAFAQLERPRKIPMKFEDVVDEAEKSAVLILAF
jgi:S1-C subfamily serine protease